MVSVSDVKPGNLLVSARFELCRVIEICLDLDTFENSLISGINEDGIKFVGTPDKWFYLWDSSVNLEGLVLRDKNNKGRRKAKK